MGAPHPPLPSRSSRVRPGPGGLGVELGGPWEVLGAGGEEAWAGRRGLGPGRPRVPPVSAEGGAGAGGGRLRRAGAGSGGLGGRAAARAEREECVWTEWPPCRGVPAAGRVAARAGGQRCRVVAGAPASPGGWPGGCGGKDGVPGPVEAVEPGTGRGPRSGRRAVWVQRAGEAGGGLGGGDELRSPRTTPPPERRTRQPGAQAPWRLQGIPEPCG